MTTVRPLVSVVTPTWQRHELLVERCIPAVRAQTYPNVEHLIVSDGPDPELASKLASLPPSRVPIRFYELGRNWSTFLTESFCVIPSTVGDFLAHGEFLTNWADDDYATPEHLELSVDALERENGHFSFPQVTMLFPDGRNYVIPLPGVTQPVFGQITCVVYRASLIDRSHWQMHEGMMSDWTLFKRWLNAGAKAVFVPHNTFTHCVNH